MEYKKNYDFSKSFFLQYKEFLAQIPHSGLQVMYTTMTGSDYCNLSSYLKNCYLLFNSDYSEDCAYATYLERSKTSFDMYMGDGCELCYEGVGLQQCHRALFSSDCYNCMEVYFSKNLKGCSRCFGCVNLRNKRYHIFNQPYTKEDYFKEIGKLDPGSYKALSALHEKTRTLALRFPKRFTEGIQNVNVSGDYIFNSKNTSQSYEVVGVEDSKFCHFLFLASTRDSYDFTMWGGNATRMYECMGAGGGMNSVKFCFNCWASVTDTEYSWLLLTQNSNLFACIGLCNKQYCILNKQYTKEEYEELVPRIIQHMNEMPYIDVKGRVYRYGEFFPPELSPFCYNETIAQEYFPLIKEQAIAQGYRWKDPEQRNYEITMKTEDIPDHIKDIPDSITNEIIQCVHTALSTDNRQLTTVCNEQCATAFKIIPQELQFYRRMNLPLPRLCPNCRHYGRLKQRNPLKLWERQCQCGGKTSSNAIYANTTQHPHNSSPCLNVFQTSYAPDRPEVVYCEQCYNAEVV